MENKNSVFSESLKRSIVEQILKGTITKEEARRRYNIKGKSSVLEWMRNYEKYDRCSLSLPTKLLLLKPVNSNTLEVSNEE